MSLEEVFLDNSVSYGSAWGGLPVLKREVDKKTLFHSSFFCFICVLLTDAIERGSRMWHRVLLYNRIGCQGVVGSIPSAFLDDLRWIKERSRLLM